MTARKSSRINTTPPPVVETKIETTVEPTVETVEEVLETPVAEVEEVKVVTPKTKEPVVGELHDSSTVNTLKSAQSSAEIHAAIRSKLDSHSVANEERGDLFNPAAAQALSKEKVKAIAEENGFTLNRGREIGARLMARAQQNRK